MLQSTGTGDALSVFGILLFMECGIMSFVGDTHTDKFVIDEITGGKLSDVEFFTVFLLENQFLRKDLKFLW